MLGADGSTYTPAGEWQFNFAARNLRSTDHYNTTIEQVQRQTQGTYVENLQKAFDFTLGYQLTRRTSLAVGVPFISASWSIPSPRTPVLGPRAQEDAMGIGDISVSARSWVLKPQSHPNANFAVGAGIKLPTGKADVQDRFPDINGNNNTLRYVDQSVQPGDGGWGITTEISGFKQVKRVMLFGSGNYLINPRNTNDTPSIIVNLGAGSPTAPANVDRLVNSVPDQYLVRLGGSTSLGRGFSASLAWRIEGMPRYDLIGRSDGFRRPGKEMFIEPGISYSRGTSSFSVSMPWGYYRNREPDPYTDNLGDATFPRFIILGNYSLRFGGLKNLQRPRLGPGVVGSAGNGAQPGAGADGAAAGATVTLAVTGMTCDLCVESVRSALQAVKGVTDAKVSLETKVAVVTYDPAKTKVSDLIKAVNTAKGMNPYTATVQQD